MSEKPQASARLDGLLAPLLQYGTWSASAVLLIGVAMATLGADRGARISSIGLSIARYGIGLFILMPILRVCAMCAFFTLERDRRLAAIAALVLLIIGAGLALGRP